MITKHLTGMKFSSTNSQFLPPLTSLILFIQPTVNYIHCVMKKAFSSPDIFFSFTKIYYCSPTNKKYLNTNKENKKQQ